MPKKYVELGSRAHLRSLRLKRYGLIASLLLVFIGFPLITVKIYQNSQRRLIENTATEVLEVAPTVAEKQATAEESPLSPLDIAIQQHVAALGIEAVNSFVIEADSIISGQQADLTIYARKPGLCRQTVLFHGITAVYGYDLHNTWKEESITDNQSVLPENAYTLRMEANIPTLAWAYDSENRKGLKRLEDVTLNGVDYMVIENRVLLQDADIPVIHYLNTQTGLEAHRKARFFAKGEMSDVVVHWHYDDDISKGINSINGLHITVNGVKTMEANFSSFRQNVGLTSILFKQPENSKLKL